MIDISAYDFKTVQEFSGLLEMAINTNMSIEDLYNDISDKISNKKKQSRSVSYNLTICPKCSSGKLIEVYREGVHYLSCTYNGVNVGCGFSVVVK